MKLLAFVSLFALGLASPALAAEGLDGSKMPLFWALPFAGMLLSIALGPLLFADVWHHHYGKISALWAALIVVPAALLYGVGRDRPRSVSHGRCWNTCRSSSC